MPERVLPRVGKAAADEIERLREELGAQLETAMASEAYCHRDGDYAGWWDTQALRSVMEIGDKLVELGLWERHPTAGHGRRQFYRPRPDR
jgi:hypothetical protein